jgi:hypothetical protein
MGRAHGGAGIVDGTAVSGGFSGGKNHQNDGAVLDEFDGAGNVA